MGTAAEISFGNIAARHYINGLNEIELFSDAIQHDPGQTAILKIKVIPYIDLESSIPRKRCPFHDLLQLGIFWRGSVGKFPGRIIAAAAARPIPFIKIDRIVAKRFYFVLDISLQAVYNGKYTDDAEDTDRNTKKRKESTE